jgi:hypothetical protein
VQRYGQPEERVEQIVVKPRADPTRLFPQVLGRRVRDLVRVVVNPLGGGTITQDCHIAGIHHEISEDDWTTTFDLSGRVSVPAVRDQPLRRGHLRRPDDHVLLLGRLTVERWLVQPVSRAT